MNWELFSLTGYFSIALWLCVPLLWLLHFYVFRQRGWLVHVALLLGMVAFLFAKLNSHYYVNRIQVDRGAEVEAQLTKQELARREAISAREAEVAQVRFAEDASDDFLDIAGMDEADRKYLESSREGVVPEWKKEKRDRTTGTVDDSLEAQIGSTEESEGVQSAEVIEEEVIEPILMTDKQKRTANRLDVANLNTIRILIMLGLVLLIIDYLSRANRYDRAYFPLPLPSGWVNAMTPRDPIVTLPKSPRRTLLDELKVFTRKGEPFVYVTDDSRLAGKATKPYARWPFGLRAVETLNVLNYTEQMDDDFVFETLWYGRNSFVVDSPERGVQMLERFIELLSDRRQTRAKVKQTVNIVWDSNTAIPEATMSRFESLARSAGYSLLICREPKKSPERTNRLR